MKTFDFGFGFDARRDATDPAWDPLAPFANGELGFIYRMRPENLFQNAAGTTAVTADGDSVGYVRDLSPNGFHATQSTDARRPVYHSSPDRLTCTLSRLSTPQINLTGGNKFTLIVAFRRTGNAVGIVAESSSNTNTIGNTGSLIVSTTALGAISCGGRGNSAIGSRATANITRPYERVVAFELDIGGATLADEVQFTVDGAHVTLTDSFGPLGGGNLGNYQFHFGNRANDGGTTPLVGDIIGVYGIARSLTADELANAASYVGEDIGFHAVVPQEAGPADIEHLISYGQSLSVGIGAGAVRLTSQPHDSLMFSGGVRAQDGGTEPWVQHASLVPLVEAQGPTATGGDRYETPLSGAALFGKERGTGLRYLCSAPGQGNVTISTLSKPGVLYERFLDDVRYGRRRCMQMGKSHKSRAFMWFQGEADGANNSYAANLNTLRTSIDGDVKALTGQPDDVWCLVAQLGRAKIGLAQLAASDSYGFIRVAFPLYFLPTTDGVHPTPEGYDIAGAYVEFARQQVLDQGDTTWQPLRITGHSVAGAVLDLTYDPVGSLVFDTTIVSAQTNHGFRLFNSGESALTINSVAIVGGNTVRITAASSIPAGAILRYGFSDPTDHTADIAKGNLRDSQGDTVVFEGQGLDYPMHQWAVLEQRTVA